MEDRGTWKSNDRSGGGGTWRGSPSHNFIKQFWEWASPWIQILGFIILVAFTVGGKSEKFDAQAATLLSHDQRLAVLEARSNEVNGKLDMMINWFGIHKK